jgi:fatty acid desaturase
MSEQKHKLSDYVSAEEIKQLKKTNNVMAVYLLLKNWLMATALFALVAVYPNVFTIIFAVVMLGGVQMAMGAFLHDCSHRAMFSNQKFNDVLGHWLGGLPVLVPMSFYRPYHFAHHTAKNESEDPDVQNIKNYPVTKSSMSRKIFRDVIGLSGLKSTIGVFLFVLTGRIGNSGAMGIKKNTPVSRGEILKTTFTNYRDVFILHGLVIAALIQLGHGELYGLWWAAMIFAQPLILRVRQIGEHGAMPELFHEDVRKTTRTTLPTWWEKFIFGPNFINFHHEHHLAATIPSYSYPKLNKMLQERGYYQGNEQALVKEGYMEVLRIASSKVA